jgi:hypothetical protein
MHAYHPSGIPPRWDPNEAPDRHTLYAAMRCPFLRRRNPYADEAARRSQSWLDLFYPNSKIMKRAVRAEMPSFIAGFYPEATLDQLCVATYYLFWAFALDDLGDESETGRNPAWLARIFSSLEPLFKGMHAKAYDSATLRALDDILQRLARFASPQEMSAFSKANLEYFGGMLWEAGNRSIGWTPDEAAYKSLRPAIGAVPPFFELIFPINGIRLPDEIRCHPGVQALTKLAGRIVCWINDVFSYEKEKLQSDVHNLVIILETREELATGDAFSRAVSFSNREVDEFMELAATLPSFGRFNNEVRRYTHTLESMMRTTLDWTLTSSRYSVQRDSSSTQVA